MVENLISKEVINLSIQLHSELGPGLLESLYEKILLLELRKMGFKAESQVDMPVYYKGELIKLGFRADIVVENKVILELKSIERINRAHFKQLQTYLKLSNIKLGLLLNFGSPTMKEGIKRIINGTI